MKQPIVQDKFRVFRVNRLRIDLVRGKRLLSVAERMNQY